MEQGNAKQSIMDESYTYGNTCCTVFHTESTTLDHASIENMTHTLVDDRYLIAKHDLWGQIWKAQERRLDKYFQVGA